MARPSDRIRELIEQCPASRYELARAAGISDAILSRFLERKAALTTDSLDRLADVLGFELVPAARPVGRPMPKGRRSKKVLPDTKGDDIAVLPWISIDASLLEHAAVCCAKTAYTQDFQNRNGVYPLEHRTFGLGRDLLVYYNNSPYPTDSKLRDDETDRIRQQLQTMQLREVAFAKHSKTEADDAYAFAMLIDLGVQLSEENEFYARAGKVLSAIQDEVEESGRCLDRIEPTRALENDLAN